MAPTALAYKPDDPQVRQMVERGLGYLTSHGMTDVPGGAGTKQGVTILCGYAAHKAGREESDPLVARGLEAALSSARRNWEAVAEEFMTYEMTVAILMLADMDPKGYRREIKALVDGLVRMQKPHGGWGYEREPVGDTSQTQYVLLALWTADRAEVDVPPSSVERGLMWLLQVQDPSGGWDYHPEIPPKKTNVELKRSLALAGMGTVLIGGDFFKFYQGTGESAEDLGLPKAFRRVRKESPTKRRNTNIKPEQIERAVQAGQAWLSRTPYKRSDQTWHYYTAYAAERFYSFYELSKGEQPPEPAWYNEWVEELSRNQAGDGSWGHANDPGREGPVTSTAFAVLFLVRSTKKAIGVINQGMLQGGYSLPKSTKNAKLGADGVQGDAVAASLNDMLKMLENDEATDFDPEVIPPALPLASDPDERAKQIGRLERLARGQTGTNPQGYIARRMAVRTLVQSGELSVVPTLIFALSDGDKKVQKLARDGLRLLGRRFDGFGMTDEPTPEEIIREQRRWREWYLGLVPTYVFVD